MQPTPSQPYPLSTPSPSFAGLTDPSQLYVDFAARASRDGARPGPRRVAVGQNKSNEFNGLAASLDLLQPPRAARERARGEQAVVVGGEQPIHYGEILCRVVRNQDQIDAGVERRGARGGDPSLVGIGGGHAEIVGEENPVVAPRLAQKAGDDGARERYRTFRVEHREARMAQHCEGTVAHERTEGDPIAALELIERSPQVTGFEVRVLVDRSETGEMLERATHAGFSKAQAILPRDRGDDHRVGRDRALADTGIAVVGIDEILVEIDDRREIEIDPEARQRAALRQPVVAGRRLACAFLGKRSDDRRDRRLPRQRRRDGRDCTALLVGRDQQRRQALAPANTLPGYDLPVDGLGGKSFDMEGAYEDAGNDTAHDQSIDVGDIAMTDDEMPTEPGQLRGISG